MSHYFLSPRLSNSQILQLCSYSYSQLRQADDNYSFSATKPIVESLTLAPRETLKLTFLLKEDSKAARPHQAFLLVSEEASGLETFYPLSIKGESGKARVELVRVILPFIRIYALLTLYLIN